MKGEREDSDFIFQPTERVRQLPSDLLQVRASIKEVVSVRMKYAENSVLLHGYNHICSAISRAQPIRGRMRDAPLRMMRTIHRCSSGVDLL